MRTENPLLDGKAWSPRWVVLYLMAIVWRKDTCLDMRVSELVFRLSVQRSRILMGRNTLSLVTLTLTTSLLLSSKFRGSQWFLGGPSLPFVLDQGISPNKRTAPLNNTLVPEIKGSQILRKSLSSSDLILMRSAEADRLTLSGPLACQTRLRSCSWPHQTYPGAPW